MSPLCPSTNLYAPNGCGLPDSEDGHHLGHHEGRWDGVPVTWSITEAERARWAGQDSPDVQGSLVCLADQIDRDLADPRLDQAARARIAAAAALGIRRIAQTLSRE